MQDQNKELWEQIKAAVVNYAKQYDKKFSDYYDEIKDYLDKNGGFEGLIKEALNLEELTVEKFAFSDAITWIKSNFDSSKFAGAVMYKKENEVFVDIRNQQTKYNLHICFIDSNNEALLDGSVKHMVVHCDEMDDALIENFGDKDTLLIK